MAGLTLIAGSSNVITLDELTNTTTAVYENSAVVTFTLTDMTGTEVSGETWPVTLSATTESPRTGKYQVVLSKNLAITAGKFYLYTLTASTGGSPATAVRTWSGKLVAVADRD